MTTGWLHALICAGEAARLAVEADQLDYALECNEATPAQAVAALDLAVNAANTAAVALGSEHMLLVMRRDHLAAEVRAEVLA